MPTNLNKTNFATQRQSSFLTNYKLLETKKKSGFQNQKLTSIWLRLLMLCNLYFARHRFAKCTFTQHRCHFIVQVDLTMDIVQQGSFEIEISDDCRKHYSFVLSNTTLEAADAVRPIQFSRARLFLTQILPGNLHFSE